MSDRLGRRLQAMSGIHSLPFEKRHRRLQKARGDANEAGCREEEMNLANASVGQIMIPVKDFDSGTVFYRDVLGVPFLFSAPPDPTAFSWR
jgi:hypothetical protein